MIKCTNKKKYINLCIYTSTGEYHSNQTNDKKIYIEIL